MQKDPPSKAQRSLQKRGQKECKHQIQWMNTGKQYPLDTQGSYTCELKLFVFAKNINLYIENSNTTNKTKTLKSKLKKN